MGLNRRIPRHARENALRYLALFFLAGLIIFIVVSMVGAADATIRAVEDGAARNCREGGQFVMLRP